MKVQILILTFCSLLQSTTSEVLDLSYPLINKCCRLDENFNITSRKCEPSPNPLNSTQWVVPESFSSDLSEFSARWKVGAEPACSKEVQTIKVPLNSTEMLDKSYFFDRSGVLLETTYDEHDEPFDRNHAHGHYCVDPLPDSLILRICQPLCNDQEPCIRKCCPHGNHFSSDLKECVPTVPGVSHDYHLPIYSHMHQTVKRMKVPLPRVTTGKLSCKGKATFSTSWGFANQKLPYKILTNDTIVLFQPTKNKWTSLSKPIDYCVDHFRSNNNTLCEGETDILYLCLGANVSANTSKTEEEKEKSSKASYNFEWIQTLAKVTLIIALVSLLLTAIIVFLLIDRVNLHSWTRFSFIISEFIFLFMFSLIYSQRFQRPEKYPKSCVVFAVMFHFVGLMTMCWLSIINFDLWWTFKVLKPTSSQKFDIRRYICYLCFSLGVPLIIISVALGLHSSKPRFQPSASGVFCRKDVEEKLKIEMEYLNSPIHPDYGEMSCSLSVKSLGTYWYGPLCFLLLANVIFFFATTARMASLRRMTRRASVESTGGRQAQSNQIFMKIFIVSGVTWNIELIGWLFKVDGKYRLDIVHHFQAMALFYIFVCKREVLRSLQRKYPIITKVIPPIVSLHRTGTMASMSTDASSRARVGRKMSSASDNSIVAQSFQRQESFDMQVSPSSAPPPERV